jgi:hypothetical protein
VNWPHDVLDFLMDLPARDLALLLVFAAAMLFWVLEIRATTRLGPIAIAPLACDGTAPSVAALTSQIRERLAHSGLNPDPAVPGGAPRTDLLDAIAESDVPQVGWVAKVIALIPRPTPPTYTLQVTLLAPPPSARRRPWSQQPPPEVPRLRYSLEGPGASVFETVAAASADEAIDRLVAAVFAAVSRAATGAFPIWARWTSPVAAGDYIEGLALVQREQLDPARALFDRADRIESTNALPRLQLANLDELAASTGTTQDPPALAAALKHYLEIAAERPDLVEPRYRGSIVAAMLRDAATAGDVAAINERVADLGAAADLDALQAALDKLAKRQAGEARRLLRFHYILLHHHRLRNRYELRGVERRELLRTLRVSAQCRALRREPGRLDLWYGRARVWWWLNVRRLSCGWQSFYNGACFYSLLLARTGSEKHAESARRHLRRAVERGGKRLDREWTIDYDPDLQPLRDHDQAAWRRLVTRLHNRAVAERAMPAAGAARVRAA